MGMGHVPKILEKNPGILTGGSHFCIVVLLSAVNDFK
jgi:hypothetical protein